MATAKKDTPQDKAPTLIEAWAAMQSCLKPLPRSGSNPHFNSSYVTLDTIIEYIRPMLFEYEFGFYQTVRCEDSVLVISTVFPHVPTGHVKESSIIMPIPQNDNPQKWVSMYTYAKRAGLVMALGLSGTDVDDDGNKASAQGKADDEPDVSIPLVRSGAGAGDIEELF